MIQESFNLGAAHGVGMTLVVEIDELSNPITVTVFSARTEMAAPANDGNLFKQAGRGGVTP